MLSRILIPVIATMLLICNVGVGQNFIPGARFDSGLDDPDSTRPAAGWEAFDWDAQVFSPVEFSDGEQLRPQSGFFFTVDKLYTSISGDGDTEGGSGDNYIWGTRYEAGYMNSEDDGWLFVYERSEGNEFLNGAVSINPNPTLYTAVISSAEFNKVFRQRLSSGGWLEPYIGLRFVGHSDSTLEDFGQGVIGGVFGNRFTQRVTNNAFGLNLGGRLIRRRGRFRYTHDFAMSPTYNQQRFRASDFTESRVPFQVFNTDEIGDSDNSFVPVVDYRFEVAYNLSRDFGVRGGASLTYLWDGVARANTNGTFTNPNSIFGTGEDRFANLVEEDLLSAGFSFGIEYRR